MDGSCSAAIALTTEEIESLLFMREEEKLARDSYLVLGALWEMAIFDNITVAEQKHMDAIENLIDCYKLTDPPTEEIGTFTNPDLQAWFDNLMLDADEFWEIAYSDMERNCGGNKRRQGITPERVIRGGRNV